jgi:hypothetical protein
MLFMSPAECERAEVDVPDAIVDVFQACVLPAQAEVISVEWAATWLGYLTKPVKLTVDCSARNVSAMP